MKSFLTNGTEKISFARLATFIIVLISQLMICVALWQGVFHPPVVDIMQTQTGQELIKYESTEWSDLGDFAYQILLGTALLVGSLYGVNKAANAVSEFSKTRTSGSQKPPKIDF